MDGGAHSAQIPMVNASMAIPEVSSDLIRRFGLSGPRYTSYPTADRFDERFDANRHVHWLEQLRADPRPAPLSLYVHVPFCQSLCYYCACNKIVTKDRRRAQTYVDYLLREVALQAQHLGEHRGERRQVCQLHWGGGTPTFLRDDEMSRLMAGLREHFELLPDGEYSIEIDPRTVSAARIATLAGLGFNRMSLGVQDFDVDVQKAVHRLQPAALTIAAIEAARANGFSSINLDLIYGLPLQTVASFAATLDRVIDAGADRIALYNYAHLPARFKPQRRIDAAQCPDGDVRVQIFLLALRKLTAAGYAYIGLDHFARHDDELARAAREGTLQRNFQGYSTRPDCDLLALGVSSISKIGPTYSQNVRTLDDYYDRLDAGQIPVMRGIELSADDLLRRRVIMGLMCEGRIDKLRVGADHGIDFDRYFASELAALEPLAKQGLAQVDPDAIVVLPKGRLLVRAVCMAFDRYLNSDAPRASYSTVV